MEDVVGLLASAIVTQVVGKASSAMGDQVMLLCNYKDDLKETLKSMEAVLKDAEGRSVKDEHVRLWLKRLKNVALDISDMLDEFDTHNDKNASSTKLYG
ncbi:hypothetical protein E2562_013031 [Oryza meyeriana var. granulata]|uniref:Disease resistance N-terminal domain-containing protein n=1 Tax=Oryza meyeriana var. granulata TaxID=110450 RepID=A0A6G1DIB5_9ORYZ|nr:hypothetical protein E2562_013031 [Oryza meyeriana var. granulata]